jgi:hypothetical protein
MALPRTAVGRPGAARGPSASTRPGHRSRCSPGQSPADRCRVSSTGRRLHTRAPIATAARCGSSDAATRPRPCDRRPDAQSEGQVARRERKAIPRVTNVPLVGHAPAFVRTLLHFDGRSPAFEKLLKASIFKAFFLVLPVRIELTTSPLPREWFDFKLPLAQSFLHRRRCQRRGRAHTVGMAWAAIGAWRPVGRPSDCGLGGSADSFAASPAPDAPACTDAELVFAS